MKAKTAKKGKAKNRGGKTGKTKRRIAKTAKKDYYERDNRRERVY